MWPFRRSKTPPPPPAVIMDPAEGSGCFHRHWHPVDERGFQSCGECGVSRFVGTAPCSHKWVVKDRDGIYRGHYVERKIGEVLQMHCVKCGEVKFIEYRGCE